MKKQGNETKSEMNKKISEIMKTDVYTVSDEATIKEVLQMLVESKTSGLPIVNAKNQVVGFISDGDIMKFIAKQNPRIIDMTSFITVWYDTESFEKKLHDLMELSVMELATTKLISVDTDYDIDEVAKVLGEKKIKKVPVLEDGKLAGVISRSDILRYILGVYLEKEAEAEEPFNVRRRFVELLAAWQRGQALLQAMLMW